MSSKLNLPELISNFLKFQENINSFSPHSLKAYKLDLSQAYNNCTTQMSEDDFKKYTKKSLYKWANLSLASRNRKVATLKSFSSWLFQEKHTEDDFSHQLICPKVQRKIPHFISVDEALSCLHAFVKSPLQTDPHHIKKLNLFLILYGCGLRISEACNLKWSQIDLDQKQILILGKGQKERLVSAPEIVFSNLLKLKKSTDSIYVFNLNQDKALDSRTGYEWIRQVGQAAQLISPLHPHALRHSFATHLLTGGSNLRVLQKMLGHESLRATEIYTHLSLDQLTQTVDKFHPLGNKKIS